MCFFNTGQGNCIALRVDEEGEGSKLLFIDCGCSRGKCNKYREILSSQTKYPGQKVAELFKNVRRCEIFITHNHTDHDNLCQMIKNVGARNRCLVFDPLYLINCDEFDHNSFRLQDFLLEKEDEFRAALPRIEKSLGSRVRVVPIKPKRWQRYKPGDREHDFNIMYLVEFAGRRILFTGDVSPQLFTQIMTDPRYEREIRAVDFLVLSHHGSNASGELMTKAAVNPEMCIICSNPDENDQLPWSQVANFQFKNGKGVTVTEHSVSTKERSEKMEQPVFVTCNAVEGYYELVIEANGRTSLFDGPVARNKGKFCFQSL
jgi:metal-dependent hydrolase (beta-lactamase superfamily II)